jgi:hypothetical protein
MRGKKAAKEKCRKGSATSPEVAIWRMMIQRCNNPHYCGKKGYGAAICNRWLGADGFANFLADLGPQPFPGAGLRRLDENKGFEPGNVVWGPTRQKLITFNGKTMPMAEWARELGIEPKRFCQRIRAGWTMKSMHCRPSQWRRRVPRWIEDFDD